MLASPGLAGGLLGRLFGACQGISEPLGDVLEPLGICWAVLGWSWDILQPSWARPKRCFAGSRDSSCFSFQEGGAREQAEQNEQHNVNETKNTVEVGPWIMEEDEQ